MSVDYLLEELKERELEIIQLMADGATNQQIADKLYISTNTVRWYNKQIYSKFGVNSRIKVVNLAREWGLIDGDDQPSHYPSPETPQNILHNMPQIPTSFVGRQVDIEHLLELIDSSRLLTLVGPPGVGKTRLAIELAKNLADENAFAGIYYVPLANLTQAEFVPQAVLQSFGLRESAQAELMEILQGFIGTQELLLILDNFEHVLAAHWFVKDLYTQFPKLKILVTSREALELVGEQLYDLEPFRPPEENDSQLTENNAVQLFIDRARAHKPRWQLRDDDYEAVGKICQYLEGIPLALELAAARLNILTPRHILQQFNNRLDLVTSGPRDLPQRHKTLRDAIAWSYDLLDETEKLIFMRLGLFHGGSTLDSIQTVCFYDQNADVVEIVASLIRKSLLIVYEDENHDPRFTMLETLREYAMEQLQEHPHQQRVQEKYKDYYIGLAVKLFEMRVTSQVGYWMIVCETELDNFRATLAYCLEHQQADRALTILNSIYWALGTRGYSHEGIDWYKKCFAQADELLCEIAIPAHHAQGELLRWYGAIDKAYQVQLNALALAEGQSDKVLLGMSYGYLALLGLYTDIKDKYQRVPLEDVQQAIRLIEEANNVHQLGWLLNVQGVIYKTAGNFEQAKQSLETALEIGEELNNSVRVATVIKNLADIASLESDYGYAANLLQRSLEKNLSVGNIHLTVGIIISIAALVAEVGLYNGATKLLGAIEHINQENYFTVSAPNRSQYDLCLEAVHANLSETEAFDHWNDGYQLSLDETVTLALELTQSIIDKQL